MGYDLEFLDASGDPKRPRRGTQHFPVEETPSTWTALDSQDNATATATRAGVGGQRHYITGVQASFSAAATKLLQIKDGAAVILEFYVANGAALSFPSPLEITAGAAAAAVLAASGTPGTLGKVCLQGYTRPA